MCWRSAGSGFLPPLAVTKLERPSCPLVGCGIPAPRFFLLDEKQRVEHDRFRERDRKDRLNQNLCRGHRIAPHGIRSFHTDQTDCNGRTQRRQTNMQATVHIIFALSFPSAAVVYTAPPSTLMTQPCAATGPSVSCWQINIVNTAVNNMKTSACTKPITSSRK